jgi:hypothetical protein
METLMSNNSCAICEEKFTTWSEYASHKMSNTCYKKIMPIRTTSRTHTQIVKDWESKNERGLI